MRRFRQSACRQYINIPVVKFNLGVSPATFCISPETYRRSYYVCLGYAGNLVFRCFRIRKPPCNSFRALRVVTQKSKASSLSILSPDCRGHIASVFSRKNVQSIPSGTLTGGRLQTNQAPCALLHSHFQCWASHLPFSALSWVLLK